MSPICRYKVWVLCLHHHRNRNTVYNPVTTAHTCTDHRVNWLWRICWTFSVAIQNWSITCGKDSFGLIFMFWNMPNEKLLYEINDSCDLVGDWNAVLWHLKCQGDAVANERRNSIWARGRHLLARSRIWLLPCSQQLPRCHAIHSRGPERQFQVQTLQIISTCNQISRIQLSGVDSPI